MSGLLTGINHVTVPCGDLRIAEQFYVGLLGGRVVVRIDAERRRAMGWSDADIDAKSADHIAVVFGDSALRLDLFEYPEGIPPAYATQHPHIGFTIAPEDLLAWRDRLTAHGVVVVGPHRLGRPGQASIYFNDPFGNHFEIGTDGYADSDLPIGGPGATSLAYAWPDGGL